MNRYDLQSLARMRLSDAEALLGTKKNDAGAYYLAGYAVECAIKACIAKNQGEYPFPPRLTDKELSKGYYTHDIEALIVTAELRSILLADMAADAILQKHWGNVTVWNEAARYNVAIRRREAEDLIAAVNDPVNGVLRWLENHW